jgi:SRSO17 transposase
MTISAARWEARSRLPMGLPPMLCVPSSLNELLLLFAPCFSRPTFETFRALVEGQVSPTSLRTVCGMLVGSRLSGVWHHACAHRFFSSAKWSVDELGLRVAELIVSHLVGPRSRWLCRSMTRW